MARRIPLSEAKASKRTPKTPKVEIGDETVVSLPPPEKTFEVEVVEDEVASAPDSWPMSPAPLPQMEDAPPTGTGKALPGWRQKCWRVFPFLAALFVACVVMQIYLAGAFVFGATTIEAHKTFIHVLELLPPLMVIFGFLGGRKSAGWWSVGLLAAIEVQYALVSISDLKNPSKGLLFLEAAHTVNALFIFAVGLLLVGRYPFWRKPSPA